MRLVYNMLHNFRDIVLFLNFIRLNNLKIINLISDGSINSFMDTNEKFVSRMHFLKDSEKRAVIDGLNTIDLESIKYELKINGYKYVTILDEHYPKDLLNIYDAPAIMYYKGNLFNSSAINLAVVGSRKPSDYGIWITKKLIRDLSKYNINIISGMALGIDYYAHKTALESGMNSIGILASSIDIRYPKTNIPLYEEMEKRGLLLSEFPLNTNPIKRNFVYRNRIISGISFGTLVVEAQENSGSLITSKYALEQNRQVYAIPGNVNSLNSIGTNTLIKRGAKLVDSVEDIIEEIGYLSEVRKIKIDSFLSDISDKELSLLEILKDQPLSINDISNVSGLDLGEIYTIIYKLEQKNLIENIGSNIYVAK